MNETDRNAREYAFYYYNDHLGSAAYLTDDCGQVTQTLNYLPYGEDWVDIQNNLDPRLGQYTFNGKEKDWESGFHYYGARYYWSEVLTGWLSVDPMADKYPNISPYAYCAWNPVRLIDPNGDTVTLSGDAKLIGKALTQIRERSSNLYFSVDDGGRLNATQRGNKELTKEETYMFGIINSTEVNINLRVQDNDHIAMGYEIGKGGGSYCGNRLRYNNDGGIIGADAFQAININTMKKIDRLSWSTGELIWHEISEAYEGGLIAINNRMFSPPSNKLGTTYSDAHCAANSHFHGDVATNRKDNPTMATIAILYNKCK